MAKQKTIRKGKGRCGKLMAGKNIFHLALITWNGLWGLIKEEGLNIKAPSIERIFSFKTEKYRPFFHQ